MEVKSRQTESGQEEAAAVLARYVEGLGYEDLPVAVVEITKKGILDTIGVTLAASGTVPEARALAELFADAGGKPESTVLGFGGRVPAWHAGYVNGALSHWLDYDSMHWFGGAHINAPVVPAALALAERQGGVSGKQFVTAVALGVDLHCRLAKATGRMPNKWGWLAMPVGGVFAAAAACGKILGLDEDRLVNAFGIAFTRAAGTLEVVFGVGANARGMYNAPSGEEGVRAALMAERGISGVRDSLEGRWGLFPVYFQGEYDRSILLGRLGTSFAAADDGFKPWPCDGLLHTYVDATLGLVREHDIRPDQVAAITLTVGDASRHVCEPIEERRRPNTSMDAKASAPFVIAVATARRKVVISDFLPQNLQDPAVLGLAQRVSYRYDPGFNWVFEIGKLPALVEIETRDGRTYQRREDFAYGHPRKPISWDDLAAKFRDCAGYAARPPSPGNVAKAVELLARLEDVDDVAQIPRLLE